VRPRHSDQDLMDLAREGSAPAFAALLHRHRHVIQRGALRAEHPDRVVETVMVGALRRLRRAPVPPDDVRGWLGALVDDAVRLDPGNPGVERMLPSDWFDRTWVRVEQRWPSGRPVLRAPRWVRYAASAVLLAGAGAATTFLIVTADTATEVLSELVAEPIEDPDMLVVPGPVVEAEPEEAPELFGDVELGELPSYDLGGGNRPGSGPTIAPRPEGPAAGADDGSGAEADERDDAEDTDGPDEGSGTG